MQKTQDILARVVSNVAAPPVLAVLGAILLAAHTAEQGDWRWALLFGLTAVLLPSLYVAWEVYRGRISDIHLPLREERTRPALVTVAIALVVYTIFTWWPAPPYFRMLALAYGLQAILFFLITLRWKISLHSAAAGSLTVLGIAAFSGSGLLFALTVPVIAWSRVRLERHTLMQTVTGALLGAMVVVISLAWVVWT